jgi:phosphate transport system protein
MEKAHRHFDDQLDLLSDKLLRMGGLVEEAIARCVQALVERDSDVAEHLIESDIEVDRIELEIDHLCTEMLALRQPMARDLRFIMTAVKINTDLERIGDLACNVAERALELNLEPQLKPYIDIPRMAECARTMVKEALDAFVNRNADLARKVCRSDALVDDLTSQIFRELLSYMIEDPQTIRRAIRITFVAKYIERIADHATNVAEMVVYLVEGKIIRHTTI